MVTIQVAHSYRAIGTGLLTLQSLPEFISGSRVEVIILVNTAFQLKMLKQVQHDVEFSRNAD